MNIKRALEVEGFMPEPHLRWLAEQAQKHTNIVEVGCWMGRGTRALADNTTGVVYAVDTWKGSGVEHAHVLANRPEDWLFQQFYNNLQDHIEANPDAPGFYKVRPCQMTSLEAAVFLKKEGPFDMIFLDAAHDYDNVKYDITAWRQLLAPGGLLCGHDYHTSFTGVRKAVDEIFPKIKRAPSSTIWYV